MEYRRTMTMNWDELGELYDDDDLFFDAAQPLSSSSSDEEYDDSRMSFSSSASFNVADFQTGQYDMWMAAPESITDRRRRLLEDMGLGSNKDLLGLPPSTNMDHNPVEKELPHVSVSQNYHDRRLPEPPQHLPLLLSPSSPLLRSRSDGGIDTSSFDKIQRKEEMLGSTLKQRLTRTLSGFSTPVVGLSSPTKRRHIRYLAAKDQIDHYNYNMVINGQAESNFLIKNLDNGKELNDVQTEKNAGQSPKVKEVNDSKSVSGDNRKLTTGNSFRKSFKKSKKKGASLFKNIKGSMGGSKSGKERDASVTGSSPINGNSPSITTEQKPASQWVKARVHGKSYKEFTALHLSQEIPAHTGSIWAMKFTYDGHYLATAGEDKVIRIWEVQECDVLAMRSGDDPGSAGGTPVHPMAMMADGRPPLPEATPEKKKKGKKKKGIPEYVHVPESVFGLSEIPFCVLEGHLDDVLDLSWSRSRLLLSSSMDKTVRLWDIETKNCLKLFCHTDYVTCIQFNPADDDYFISGSLDAKVRIWNIPDRHVVDWLDLHEMVTAVGYSNDGKVSVVGSHKGICRYYDTSDCKLEFKEQIELRTKKKPQPKKITGIQYSTGNPSQVLVTSADSRVRILDGTKIVQKFKGYKNINSQFLAKYSPDGKYVISASEDSQVYIWRNEETKGKHKHVIMKSYENFPCKEVSVTAPWPGSRRFEPPVVAMHSKRHAKKSTTTLTPPAAAAGFSPLHDDVANSKRSCSLPPLPKRGNPSMESIDDIEHQSQTDPSLGHCESFATANGSPGRLDDLTASSPSMSPSWPSGNHGHKTFQATAWGFVIVTAGLGGEIKVYQNVGLPFKVGRL